MTDETQDAARQALSALMGPLARLMLDQGLTLSDGVELLKLALVHVSQDRDPDASASFHSLRTGVHRKNIRQMGEATALTPHLSAAARVLSLWQTDPEFDQNGTPKPLSRAAFDKLVKRAKVDAAPATVLSLLESSGALTQTRDEICFVTATLVPADAADRLNAAVGTLRPHLETTVANLAGERAQMDQALRYSHLSPDAAHELETEAARLARAYLETLNSLAQRLQSETEGSTLFVAGTFTHISERQE